MTNKNILMSKISVLTIILMVCVSISGCTQEGPPLQEPPQTPQLTLIETIPVELSGFPEPISASFDPTEPLDGIKIPGGYGGREWLTDTEFVLAMVMDFQSPQKAAELLAELKPFEAVLIDLGDEGYEAEELLTVGTPAAKLIVWRRGEFLAVVGSGILDVSGALPPEQMIMDLAHSIDNTLQGKTRSIVGYLSLPSVQIAASSSERFHIRSPLLLSSDNLQEFKESKEITKNLVIKDEAGDYTGNGSITLLFETTVTDVDEQRMCEELNIAVYVTNITLGAYDGDDWGRGDGDIRVGGEFIFKSICDGTSLEMKREFVTSEEIGDIGENNSLTMKELLGTYSCSQDICTRPLVSFRVHVRDNDEGDLIDILKFIEEKILRNALMVLWIKNPALAAEIQVVLESSNAAKEDIKQLCWEAGVTGDVLKEFLKTRGDDVGTASTEKDGKEEPVSLQVEQLACPDLTVEIVGVSPEEPLVGKEVTIMAKIVNQGTRDVTKPFYVDFIVASGGTEQTAARILYEKRLEKEGGSDTIELKTKFQVEGENGIKFFVDSLGNIIELEEVNNTDEIHVVVVPPLPDLVIEIYGISPAGDVLVGEEVNILTVVTNNGTAPSEGAKIALIIDGTQEIKPFVGLNPGQSAYVSFEYTFPSAREYTVEALVDFEGVIMESEEKNNTDSTNVSVKERDLIVKVTYVDTNLITQAGTGYTMFYISRIDFVLENRGNLDIKIEPGKTIEILFEVEIIYELHSERVEVGRYFYPFGLKAGAKIPLSYNIEYNGDPEFYPGTYTLYAKVDPNREIKESNEDNNEHGYEFSTDYKCFLTSDYKTAVFRENLLGDCLSSQLKMSTCPATCLSIRPATCPVKCSTCPVP